MTPDLEAVDEFGVAKWTSITCSSPAVAAWVVLIAMGVAWQVWYEVTPGGASASPLVRPGDGGLPFHEGRAAFVMALHPRCPCSSASVDALERVVLRRPVNADVIVLVSVPSDASDAWTDSPLVVAARAISGASVVLDTDGERSRSLGMRTSGHLLAYGADGRLAFTGGITPGRGLTCGDAGIERLSELLEQFDRATEAPVYGCALVGAGARCREEGPDAPAR